MPTVLRPLFPLIKKLWPPTLKNAPFLLVVAVAVAFLLKKVIFPQHAKDERAMQKVREQKKKNLLLEMDTALKWQSFADAEAAKRMKKVIEPCKVLVDKLREAGKQKDSQELKHDLEEVAAVAAGVIRDAKKFGLERGQRGTKGKQLCDV